mmetsp:Transcript_39241/g.111103  ORF Transcript_39241/g.111103 Transcript_39241/m.111103 type:complete len:266 (-) Transcript_39241:373-1170(-)
MESSVPSCTQGLVLGILPHSPALSATCTIPEPREAMLLQPGGRGPVRALPDRSRVSSLSIADHTNGRGPLSVLPPACRWASSPRLLQDGGRVPVRLLSCSLSSPSPVRMLYPDGSFPVSWFPARFSWFPEAEALKILLQLAGRDPVRRFSLRSSTWTPVSRLQESGRLPVRRLSLSTTCPGRLCSISNEDRPSGSGPASCRFSRFRRTTLSPLHISLVVLPRQSRHISVSALHLLRNPELFTSDAFHSSRTCFSARFSPRARDPV